MSLSTVQVNSELRESIILEEKFGKVISSDIVVPSTNLCTSQFVLRSSIKMLSNE